jgi:DNA polymerase III delta subunit
MILLIHGNDLAASRNFYFEEKNKLIDVILLEGDGLTFDQFFQNAENKSLFGSEQTILVENFFTKNKSTAIETKKIVEYLNSNKNLSIVFWESTELSKTSQALLKNATVKTFSFPQILFTFLDNVRPNNAEMLIKLFHELKQSMEVELIFFMLVRQFRIMLDLDGSDKIDEVKRMAPWQLGKMQRQAKMFGEEKLKSSYQNLFERDLALKTGKIPYSLERSIDFFLADL